MKEFRKFHTYFFDIDGTIFRYRKFETYKNSNPVLTLGASEKLWEIKNAGHTIVLTTARPESLRYLTTSELSSHDIPYDQLVMDLARGPRHLVNDMSPSNPGEIRAISWNIHRDAGLDGIGVKPL